MATPEGLSREERERRAALGVLELDDDELLIQSTQAEPTYKIGEPDIHEYDLDDRGPGSTLLEQYYSRQHPGDVEDVTELRGRSAGDYFKDKALEYGEWLTAAASIPDPTMLSEIAWANIKIAQDEPEVAAVGLGIAAATAGAAGAWTVQAGNLTPALRNLYMKRGLRPDEAGALAGKVIGEAGRSKKVIEGMSEMARPGHGYFTHSLGGGSQAGRIHRAGGTEGVSRGISEYGILFRKMDDGAPIPFMNYIGHSTAAGQGTALGERLVAMATKDKYASRWIGAAPVTFIVELPLKAGKVPGAGTASREADNLIMAAARSVDEPGMEGAKQMAQKISSGGGTFQSSRGLTHTIPPEHIKGVLVNGQIISFDKYMKLLKPARPGKSRWRTE